MAPNTPPPTRTPTITPERTREPDFEKLARLLPPWAVILWNDDHNDMLYVTRSLLTCVPSLSTADAVQIMYQAHLHGHARVIVCPKEQAELYRERLEGKGLTATIEAA